MKKICLSVCFGLLLVDVLLKLYTHHHIPLLETGSFSYPYGGIAVFQDWMGVDFSLNYAKNKGAAWGVLGDFQKLLLCSRIVVIGCLIAYLVKKKIVFSKYVALSLVLTGAVGNVIDYFVYGYVVDMFYFVLWGYSFPIFNLADSMIFCGIIGVLLQNILEKKYAFSKDSFC